MSLFNKKELPPSNMNEEKEYNEVLNNLNTSIEDLVNFFQNNKENFGHDDPAKTEEYEAKKLAFSVQIVNFGSHLIKFNKVPVRVKILTKVQDQLSSLKVGDPLSTRIFSLARKEIENNFSPSAKQ